MTQNAKRISWLFIALLFHAVLPDMTLSSKIMTSARATREAALESKTAPARWFRHWSINSGKSVTGEFATKPGAFKYSAMIKVETVQCSAAVIAAMWVLSSSRCFSSKDGEQPAAQKNSSIGHGKSRDREGILQVDVATGANTVGWALAGGIKYRDKEDVAQEGVQLQRVVKLLLYTETHTEEDLRRHDVMLAKLGAPGFLFDEYIQPIRFSDQRRFYLASPMTCVVVGFGGDNFESITMASLQPECKDADAADNIVCVDEFRWPCMGDAGAPLVCRNMLIGTLRKEGLVPNDMCEGQAKHATPNFTFVGYYRDWIVEHAPIKFSVWRSGSPRFCAPDLLGSRGACYAAQLLLDIWMYMYFK